MEGSQAELAGPGLGAGGVVHAPHQPRRAGRAGIAQAARSGPARPPSPPPQPGRSAPRGPLPAADSSSAAARLRPGAQTSHGSSPIHLGAVPLQPDWQELASQSPFGRPLRVSEKRAGARRREECVTGQLTGTVCSDQSVLLGCRSLLAGRDGGAAAS